jgi:hypothetical protein
MPAAGQPPPPFIGQGEVAYKRVAWLLVRYPDTGMQCLRFDGGPGGTWFLCASWQPMCLSGGGFKGGFAGARVWLLFIHRFKGLVDGRVWAAQGSAWRRSIGTGSHSAGDGFTASAMAA